MPRFLQQPLRDSLNDFCLFHATTRFLQLISSASVNHAIPFTAILSTTRFFLLRFILLKFSDSLNPPPTHPTPSKQQKHIPPPSPHPTFLHPLPPPPNTESMSTFFDFEGAHGQRQNFRAFGLDLWSTFLHFECIHDPHHNCVHFDCICVVDFPSCKMHPYLKCIHGPRHNPVHFDCIYVVDFPSFKAHPYLKFIHGPHHNSVHFDCIYVVDFPSSTVHPYFKCIHGPLCMHKSSSSARLRCNLFELTAIDYGEGRGGSPAPLTVSPSPRPPPIGLPPRWCLLLLVALLYNTMLANDVAFNLCCRKVGPERLSLPPFVLRNQAMQVCRD